LFKRLDTREPVTVLDNINVEIFEGEFVSFIGPSGCGKSTFLKIIAGLEEPSKGEARLNGNIIEKPGPDRGMCFQEYALFPWKTARQNIEFGLRAKGLVKEEYRKISDKYINLVKLVGSENKYPHQLSGGMKQRCALARIFALDPEILLLDEPLAAVDAQTRLVLQEELLKIWGDSGDQSQRKTVINVTHSIEEAVFLSDRVFVMDINPGKIKEIIKIDLPRPRKNKVRSAAKYSKLREEIWKLIRKEVIIK